MNRLLFTIVIPTKNRASLLLSAIRSVQEQTFSHWELIIVDNGSTDDTAAVVKPLLSDKIKYLYSNKTEGPAGARNLGIKSASPTSLYISLLDDDDTYYPEFLEYTYKFLEGSSREIGFTWTGIQNYYPGKETTSVFFWDPPFRNKEEAFNGFLKNRLIGTGYGITFKKEVFETVGFFDDSLKAAEDTDFFLRVLKHYFYIKIPDTLVRITRQETNHVNKDSFDKVQALEIIYNKHREAIMTNGRTWYNFKAKISGIYYRLGERAKGRSVLRDALRERFNFRIIVLWLRMEML